MTIIDDDFFIAFLYASGRATANAFTIAIAIGSVLGLILIGWLVLFLYYNTCGRREDVEEEVKKGRFPPIEEKSQKIPTNALEEGPYYTKVPYGSTSPTIIQRIYMNEHGVQTDLSGGGDLR